MRSPLLAAVLWVTAHASAAAQVPSWVNDLLVAAQLPVVAAEVRLDGVPGSEVQQVLDAMAAARMRAHEARQVLVLERDAVRDHGPVDNFGAFVQSKLSAGLRGRDLAAAIKAEHVARGKGKPATARGNSRGNAPGNTGVRGAQGSRGGQDTVQRGGKGAATRPSTSDKGGAKGPPAGKRPDRPNR